MPAHDSPVTSAALHIRIYLAGDAPNSVAALANLRRALESHPERQVELEIIDVLAEPQRAIRDGVLVTPMMIKAAPAPERRLLGNLRDHSMLLAALGLAERADG